MMKRRDMTFLIGMLVMVSVLWGGSGCEVGTGDTASRDVDINVWGVYRAVEGRWEHDGAYRLVSRASGSPPVSMDIRQHGDKLEGVANNGVVFRGTIGSVMAGAKRCSFTLRGKTTVGNSVLLSGHIDVSGSEAVMSGTWVEDALYGEFYGVAAAPPQPIHDVTIDPAHADLSPGDTRTFSAAGGDGNYTWSIISGSSHGSVSPTTGRSTEFRAATNNITMEVTAQLRVRDGGGKEATATIRISPN